MAAANPGSQGRKQLGKLARVDAVLLQVWQTGIVAFGGRTAGAPVAARHVFGLKNQEGARVLEWFWRTNNDSKMNNIVFLWNLGR